MSVEKLPDGSGYKVRWRDSSGASRRKTVRLYRDALALDGEMKRKKAMGELIAHEKGTIRLLDFWELWWQRHALPNLSPRTRDTYLRLWRKHLKPSLGSVRLRDLSAEQVAELYGRLTGGLAPASVRQCAAILQGVLQRAVEWRYIPSNPAQGVRKPKLVRQREPAALTPEQVEALRAEMDPRSAAIVGVLAGTGLRPGELRGLRWSDVRGDHILVERAVSSSAIGPTKTNRKRQVRAFPGAVLALKEWRLASTSRSLVFPGHHGGTWSDGGWRMWQRQVFAPAAERAGFAGLVPYDLRHTWVSQMIASGADILQIAAQAGHSPMMTLTVYGHMLGVKYVPSECPRQANIG